VFGQDAANGIHRILESVGIGRTRTGTDHVDNVVWNLTSRHLNRGYKDTRGYKRRIKNGSRKAQEREESR
jgi:hypothetical protein